jgi:hypothetical protein
MSAWRPKDHRSAKQTEEDCVKGLRTELHLKPADNILKDADAITLTSWIESIKEEIELKGLDAVFRINTVPPTYLLENWGRTAQGLVPAWILTLRHGVGVAAADAPDPCEYDLNNLRMSGQKVKNSITLDMWKRVEKDLPARPTGPEIFAAVVRSHQATSTAAVRTLVMDLLKLELKQEPGQDVETFGDKVSELARRIEGTGGSPEDLNSLVASRFLGSSTTAFEIDAAAQRNAAERGNAEWKDVIRDHKILYRELKNQNLWEAETHRKKDGEITMLKAAIEELKQRVESSTSTNDTTRGGDFKANVICHKCNKKGHFKRDCPENTGGGTNHANARPKEGEAHTKPGTDGRPMKWCDRCRRWTKGDKAHLTGEHVVGKKTPAADVVPAAPATVVAAAPASHLAGGSGGAGSLPSFRLASGFMAKQGQALHKSKSGREWHYCETCDKWKDYNCSRDHSHITSEIMQGACSLKDEAGRN